MKRSTEMDFLSSRRYSYSNYFWDASITFHCSDIQVLLV